MAMVSDDGQWVLVVSSLECCGLVAEDREGWGKECLVD